MEEKNVNQISNITLSAIKVISKNGAVKDAIGSLVIWGAINLGAWFLLGREDLHILEGISNPSTDIKIVFYGGAIIGSIMLAFAALGAITMATFTVLLDGISLVGVGAWNLIHDIFANSALKPYGYFIQGNKSPIWYILGVSQLVWGFRQFGHFNRVSSWSEASCPPSELDNAKNSLKALSKEPENIEHGRLGAAMTHKGFLFGNKTVQYFGWFSGEHLIFMSTGMNDYILLTKADVSKATFGKKGIMTISAMDRGALDLSLGASSERAIKDWGKDVLSTSQSAENIF